MAKINYFQDMEQRYQSNGNESWLNLIKPADIQKSAVKSVLPNIDLLKSLGWTPVVSVEDGFKRVIEYKT
jgi:nucleoside-diphosphate-sugar epimerase